MPPIQKIRAIVCSKTRYLVTVGVLMTTILIGIYLYTNVYRVNDKLPPEVMVLQDELREHTIQSTVKFVPDLSSHSLYKIAFGVEIEGETIGDAFYIEKYKTLTDTAYRMQHLKEGGTDVHMRNRLLLYFPKDATLSNTQIEGILHSFSHVHIAH